MGALSASTRRSGLTSINPQASANASHSMATGGFGLRARGNAAFGRAFVLGCFETR